VPTLSADTRGPAPVSVRPALALEVGSPAEKAASGQLADLSGGTVTRTGAKSQRPGCWARSGRSGRVLPRLHRPDPEGPKRVAGDEVALKVERVVDRSMDREKALS
jgi:hypothetical protein